MGAAWYRAQAELRRRWPATLALVLLVGLAGGVVLTTVAGARRSSTAYERYREETLAGDLDISAAEPDPARFEEVRRLPQVEELARAAYPFIRPQGTDLFPYLEFLAVVDPENKLLRTVDRPRVLSGRMPDPTRSDELVVIESFAEEADLSVGEPITFESFDPAQFEDLFAGAAGTVDPAGPLITLTVTGVVGAPDLLGANQAGFEPRAFLSPAFYEEYADRVGTYEAGGRARLRGGEDDVPAVVEALREIYRDDPELEVQLASETTDKIDDTFGVLVVALLLCAACAGLAGVAAVGQALARHVSRSAGDQGTLASLGMLRPDRAKALTAATLPVAFGGALLAVAVAIAASPLMPVGVARRAEPDLGMSVDVPVLVLGFVGVDSVVTVLAVLSAWRVSRLTTDADDATSSRSRLSLLPRLLGTSPISPAISTGIRSALEPGRGRTAVPVRSALAGIAFGVAGLVAVVVFASSLTELADTPGRYGASWDAVLPGFASRFTDERGAELVDDPTVADLGTVTSVLARLGDEDVPVFAFAPLKGTVSVTLIEGREALREDEVVLGSRTLRNAGLGIGDTFDLSIPTGPVPLRVVGRGAFPVFDERGAVGRGVALTPAGLEALAAREGVSAEDTLNETVVVGWAPGVEPVTANAELEERIGTQVLPAAAPADVNNLEQVEDLPRVLAAFLAVMAAVALAHALVTTVRRRRRDLAVLRTFGFVRPQVWAAVGWQAATLAVVGLLVGVPLGIVAGRAAWRVVAAGIGVVDRPADPLLLLGLIGLGVLLTAALVAAPPAYMAGQVRTATALRSE